jgi:signal transduction histidine kinase
VSVLERTLTNVIHAARRPQREGLAPSADATAVVAERVDFWAALAEDQDRDVARELPVDPILVRCAEQDLAAAVDALLGNVFAHTDEGVALAVTLARTDDGAVLTVADDGPGFTAEAVVRGRSDRGSSGLGLDIARQAAEASGGALTIGTGPDGRGAVVTLTLGAP